MLFDGHDENRRDVANRYYDRYFDIEAVKILPGEYFATTDNIMIVTVLGSCVSVCLRDPVKNIGGMNHFLLPSETYAATPSVSQSARYGVFAMELLINQLLKLGAEKGRLEAKVFGGGNVMKGFTKSSVGERNSEFVVEYLNTEHIPIIASDLLDNYPRKIYFFPQTGKVEVKKIKSLHNSTIMDRESEYRMRIRNGDLDGECEFFDKGSK